MPRERQVQVDHLVAKGKLYNIEESKRIFIVSPVIVLNGSSFQELYKTKSGVLLLVTIKLELGGRSYEVEEQSLREASKWLDEHNASPEVYEEAGITLQEPSASYEQLPTTEAYERRLEELRKIKGTKTGQQSLNNVSEEMFGNFLCDFPRLKKGELALTYQGDLILGWQELPGWTPEERRHGVWLEFRARDSKIHGVITYAVGDDSERKEFAISMHSLRRLKELINLG